MLSEAVLENTRRFRKDWAIAGTLAPVLSLDLSWPSVGVVDLLTFILRGAAQTSENGNLLIKGAASYLATMAHNCWSSFEAEVYAEDKADGVVLRARKGPFISDGQEVVIRVEQELRGLLQQVPNPFPVFASFSRPIAADHNIISLFGFGLMMGLSPFAEGPWSKLNPESFDSCLELAVKLLALTSAEHYERAFPEEHFGQVPELYLHELIFPPALYAEEMPCFTALDGLLAFCEEYRLKPDALLPLMENLVLSADEVFSSSSFVYWAAVSKEAPSDRILSISGAKGMNVALLRPALIYLRSKLGLEDDWLERTEQKSGDLNRFELEKELGFLPWVRLPAKLAVKAKYKTLVKALSVFSLEEALELCKRLCADEAQLIELRLQQIFLALIQGELDQAEASLRALASEPGAEDDPWIYNELGITLLAQGRLEEGIVAMETALKLISAQTPRAYEITSNYSWALILAKRFEEAVVASARALKGNPNPVTALLNHAHALEQAGARAAFEKICERVLSLAPTDRRVIANLMYIRAPELFES